ncbi:MAG: hypothetical protein ACRYGP_26755 [Janthinobacterium lividum]
MWAPADLFRQPLSMLLGPLKHGITYLYEHTLVLVLLFVAIAAIIAIVEARTS